MDVNTLEVIIYFNLILKLFFNNKILSFKLLVFKKKYHQNYLFI